jgi:uncharacterized protein (DUF58 family)
MIGRLSARLRRLPFRKVWPTRDGWWFLGVTLGLGLAAANTGNNLVYLLCSLLCALIIVASILSEHLSMRGLEITAVLPEEAYAGRPALVGGIVTNRKRRLPSYSFTLEVPGEGTQRVVHFPYLPAGGERLISWPATFPARGRHRLPSLRLTTRFPFGLTVKSNRVAFDGEVIVYPAVEPVSPDRLRDPAGGASVPRRRRGRGDDLYNLRQYRPGDDPRLIHWRSSAKAQALTVRELEDEAGRDVRLLLDGAGRGDPAALERGLSEAASLAVHLLRRGAGVELRGPGLAVPIGRGRGQEVRILTALALYAPPAAEAEQAPASDGLRELRIPLE